MQIVAVSCMPMSVVPNLFDLATTFENITYPLGSSHYLQL